MSRNIKIVPNEFYHIYNRGVEKRDIFMNDEDRIRFLRCLKEFNNKNSVTIKDLSANPRCLTSGVGARKKKYELIVEIVCYCLMPNHFHLIMREIMPGGITLFMKKIGNGYTNYFNLKYDRVGSLFQGTYKACCIQSDEILRYLVFYIHSNPAELIDPKWKLNGIKDYAKVFKFLNSYKWSSYYDFVASNKSEVINSKLLQEILGDVINYKNDFKDDILKEFFEKDKNNISKLNGGVLLD